MTKFLLICILTITSLSSFADKADSLSNARLNYLEQELKALKAQNDSLNKELYFFRSKDDLYISMAERQLAHSDSLYGITIGVILGMFGVILPLAGYLTWTGLKKSIQKDNNDFINDLRDTKLQLVKTQHRSFLTVSSLVVNIFDAWLVDNLRHGKQMQAISWEMLDALVHIMDMPKLEDFDLDEQLNYVLVSQLSTLHTLLSAVKKHGNGEYVITGIEDKKTLLLALAGLEDPKVKEIASQLYFFILSEFPASPPEQDELDG